MSTYSAQICSVFTMEFIQAEFMVVLRETRKKKRIIHPEIKREKKHPHYSSLISSAPKLSSHSCLGYASTS